MLNRDSAQQTPSLPGPEAGAPAIPDPDPWCDIETASDGTSPVNDPPGTDNKPPGVADLDYLA